ncbi:UNVERIFIED_CONTAM: hypothetical protein PYX00_000162 [Menopon gallinae]|uniref:GBD/FH3 domain-containing protein n=1 Tax=Menopon gallinae TaxID=328185 RepID=A0AAW2I7E4_9NEOP
MAPNSEEDTRILYQNGKPWRNDNSEKEPQRPPVYNPEDYAQCLKKWGKKGNLGMQMPLYVSQSTGSIERISAEITKSIQSKRQSSPSTKSSSSSKNGDEKQSKKEKELTLKLEKEAKNKENAIGVGKELKNPIVTVAPQETEMSLRQFSSVTELLGKLKLDLRLAFPSFVQEFVGDPVDGVTLLLELLRAVQLSQASQQQRCPPQVLRRALLDEHSCLVCLKHCLRCPDASRRLASSSAGLFTLAVCIMSNVTKSRIIALELLTKACEVPATGHKPVSEALSTLRLRFGEPVRFRFLVGMLNSAGAVELLTAAMRFINAFISTAPSVQQKVYIQAELEQAGFDSKILRKTLPNHSESVKAELNKWDKNYFDVETLEMQVAELDSLRDKVQLLEKRIQILQEEKGILQSLEQCLKERCSELEEEVSIKTSTTTLTKSTAHLKPFRNYNSQQALYMNKKNAEKGESTPAEDEGISSSEQELSQDEDCNKGTIPYNITANCEPIVKEVKQFEVAGQKKSVRAPPTYPKDKIINRNVKNGKMKETNVDDGNEVNPEEDEEETTIDEVIEELRNIVNDAETEVYGKEKQIEVTPKGYRKPEEVVGNMKLKPVRSEFERDYFEEAEIVPSGLLPQPPRRTRSLVHIFLAGTEYDDTSKNEFFEDDTDTESSDSLLTSAREKRTNHKNCHHRSLEVSDSYNSSSSINTRTLFIKQQNDYEGSEANVKMGFEEAEEVKRYGEKVSKKVVESRVHPEIKREVLSPYEKLTSFQGAKAEESSFARTKFVPLPVKRSQTFHIATPDNARTGKRTEMKPKPKMGVRGLDMQRNSGGQVRTESIKYQNIDYKKNPDRNCSDRYLKKISKDERYNDKVSHPLQRRGSLDGMYFVTEVSEEPRKRLSRAGSQVSNDNYMNSHAGEEGKNLRSKSLEKMDDGLDSLVDIVFSPEQSKKPSKSEWNIEANKNIGPRTRRSLAESSLFNQPYLNNLNKETTPKPPQPAQRTSLTRNNSSSIPLHMPVEIKVAPMQSRNYFGLKTAKSECNLANLSPPKRYPPDGSSSPNEGSEHRKKEEATIYAVPSKQSRLQKFFGNPKFENSVGNNSNNQKYFECNYACTQPAPPTRKAANVAPQKVKGLLPKDSTKNEQPKINFFLGTYHQSQAAKGFLSSDSPSSASGNSFNNTFLIKRGHANAGMYSGSRNGQGGRSPLPAEVANANGRQSIMSTYSSGTNSTKVTDSLSGLY